MAPADVTTPAVFSFGGNARERIGFLGLSCALAAFTLCTLDGGPVAPLMISAALLLFAGCYFGLYSTARPVSVSVPAICVSLMVLYGVVQTMFLRQKILYDGWTAVIFWSAAAAITWLGAHLFVDFRAAAAFRLVLILFASAMCVLDLLEQASSANKYYWLIPSRYNTVFGPFAYWNNFAQFVELALPVTLWAGLSRRKPVIKYLLLGALQIAAVVASGSRAGTALVGIELLAVILLAFRHNRNRSLLFGAALAISLSTVFIYSAGIDRLMGKLEQNDQLAVRRNINRTSIAIIRERPITGWGLNTYVPVYRMFALYDDGTYVNRAHNDWLQFLAEGGILFTGPMIFLFLWSIRPAIQSVWGIGLIAVGVHALVDYPFARLGVCGWYFALIAMLPGKRFRKGAAF
ncbi:MAG: O-antigen ligase family protein [Acidobacteriaceae bacterium]|nr:O-antigen ligase family protein [Acidobacteriaceae bacterium]